MEKINLLFLLFLSIIIFRVCSFFSYSIIISDWNDLYNLTMYVNNLISYKLTQDNTPLLFTSITRVGDCVDRSKFVKLILDNNGLNNSIIFCYTSQGYHARNMVWLDGICFILDASYDDGLIQSCSIVDDYCV